MSEAPSERKLLAVERVLRKLKPGAQKAVGGGVYMRLDRAGRRRFQFRSRAGGAGQAGGTYDSWQEADDARRALEAPRRPRGAGVEWRADRRQIRTWEIDRYASEAWWPTVLLECDVLTQVDYKRGLKDLLPHVRGVTLADLESSPLLIDKLKQDLAAAKTFPPGTSGPGSSRKRPPTSR